MPRESPATYAKCVAPVRENNMLCIHHGPTPFQTPPPHPRQGPLGKSMPARHSSNGSGGGASNETGSGEVVEIASSIFAGSAISSGTPLISDK